MVRIERQHETKRPDQMRRHGQQHFALAERPARSRRNAPCSR
jgi:hypothetical protein